MVQPAASPVPTLRIRELKSRPVVVPMKLPLHTSSGAVMQAPLLLLDLRTEEGVVGRAYVFGYQPFALKPLHDLAQALGETIRGDAVAPAAIEQKLRARTKLMGQHGLVGAVLAGIDTACWDAVAVAANKPLAVLLGGSTGTVRAYNSNGLGIMPPQEAAEEAPKLLEGGFRAIKIRVGRATAEEDVAAVRAVKKAIPSDVNLMSDFNQALSVTEAIRRGRMLDREGLYWIEEPVRADDLAGCARVAAAVETPIQIGENFSGAYQMHDALAVRACDYVMPDVQRIGGVSGWLRAAALASAAGVEMSTHLFPEISAHLLTVTPTRHWLEYVDWASPVIQVPLEIRNGEAVIPDRAGTGIVWDEKAVERFRMMT